MLLGMILLAPGLIALISHLFVYTVGWSPVWMPQLLTAMAVLGVVSIIGGLRVSRLGKQT
jgi:hypothetical protein